MRQLFRRRLARILASLVVVCLLVIFGFGIYVANMAGKLPWQAEPTRIPITPFAGIPGFSEPGVSPTPTPVKATPAADRSGDAHVVGFVIAGDRFAQSVRSDG